MSTFMSPHRGSTSPIGERSQRFTNAAIAGGRVSSAKHHSISMPESFANKPSNSSQHVPGTYPEGHRGRARTPVQVGTDQQEQVTHVGHDHRPTLKVDLPTHEEPTCAREGVGSLPGPNNAQGVAILPDEKEYLHNAPHKKHHHGKGAKHQEHGLKAELPTSEHPTGSRVGIGSMPGSNFEAGVAILPEERLHGQPYGQDLNSAKQTRYQPGEMDSHLATQFGRSTSGKVTENQGLPTRETNDTPIAGLPQKLEEVTGVPEFLEGGFEHTAAGKYEALFPGASAPSKEPTGAWTTHTSVAFASKKVLTSSDEPRALEDVTGVPHFLEGGYGTTITGGKYEAVFERLLPGPGDAATSKEPSKPSAPFSQPAVFLKSRVEPQTRGEVIGLPTFVEGGFGSAVTGGKYESKFTPTLPGHGQSATSKEPTKSSAPFAQTTIPRKPVDHQAVKELSEAPIFADLGESTTVGGKYEPIFEPASPPPGRATKLQSARGSASYLGKPVSKEEAAVQVEQARRLASRKAAGVN